MMATPNNTMIEDLLALGSGLLGNLVEARHELKAQAKGRAETLARRLDLVTREEFDAAFAMLAKARGMQDELADRLASIESKLGITVKKPVKAARKNLPSVKTKKRRTPRT